MTVHPIGKPGLPRGIGSDQPVRIKRAAIRQDQPCLDDQRARLTVAHMGIVADHAWPKGLRLRRAAALATSTGTNAGAGFCGASTGAPSRSTMRRYRYTIEEQTP